MSTTTWRKIKAGEYATGDLSRGYIVRRNPGNRAWEVMSRHDAMTEHWVANAHTLAAGKAHAERLISDYGMVPMVVDPYYAHVRPAQPWELDASLRQSAPLVERTADGTPARYAGQPYPAGYMAEERAAARQAEQDSRDMAHGEQDGSDAAALGEEYDDSAPATSHAYRTGYLRGWEAIRSAVVAELAEDAPTCVAGFPGCTDAHEAMRPTYPPAYWAGVTMAADVPSAGEVARARAARLATWAAIDASVTA